MSHAYLASLVAVVIVFAGARLLIPALPVRTFARRLRGFDVIALAVGVTGLVFHCGAMFYRSTAEHLPASHDVIRAVNAMGTASRVWFSIPALLVVVALRRQSPVAVATVALALIVVGVTMYDHGPLRTHLHAIFAAVVALAVVTFVLAVPPWSARRRSAPAG